LNSSSQNNSNERSSQVILNQLKQGLLDPLAIELIESLGWFNLEGLSTKNSDLYPIAITGEGPPLLLLHGFDSSFLEYRRLAPLLKKHHKIFIPDLFGFGFCPRPSQKNYNQESIIFHLNKVLDILPNSSNIGLIGASMGGAVAMELARQRPEKINRLLLLAPAGLTGRPMPVPPLLDHFGVWFLKQPNIRKSLCRQAFADPKKSVGKAEDQIASLHLNVPGWGRSLAAFARSGGIANCGMPIPNQPLHVIWGDNDRILRPQQKKEAVQLLGNNVEEIKNCGHLPHLDQPKFVASRWLEKFQSSHTETH